MPVKARSNPSAVLSLLHKLFPPQMLIHVGAGSGTGPLHEWHNWQVPEAWLIDANSERLAWATARQEDNWHTLSAVLDEEAGEKVFHQASNRAEDGLIDPQLLRSLWPALKPKDSAPQNTQRLDTVLAEAGATPQASWIFVDCLPALPILKGAGTWLDNCSVLWLRVLLKPVEHIEPDCSLESLDTWAQAAGFRCIEVKESNHPAIGYALFARDWQAVIAPKLEDLLRASREVTLVEAQKREVSKEFEILQKRLLHLEESHNKVERLAASRQGEIDSLRAIHGNQLKFLEELKRNVTELTEYKVLAEQFKAEQEEQARIALEQLNGLKNENNELVRNKEALEKQIKDQKALLVKKEANLAEMEIQNRTLQEAIDKEKESHLHLEDELTTCKKLVEQLQNANQAHARMVEVRETENARISEELIALREKSSESERNTKALEAKLNDRESQIRQGTKRIADLDSSLNALQADKVGWEEAQKKLGEEISKYKELTEQLIKARDDQTKIASEQRSKIDSLIKQIEELAKERDELSRVKAALDKQIIDQKAHLKEREGRVSELNTKLQALQAEEVKWKELQQLLSNDIAKHKGLVEQLAIARDEQANIVSEFQADKAALVHQMNLLKTERDELSQRKESCEKEIAGLRAQLVGGDDRIAKLTADIDALRSAEVEWKGVQERLGGELEVLTRNHDDKVAQVKRLQEEVLNVTSARDALNKELGILRQNNAALEKRTRDLEEQAQLSNRRIEESDAKLKSMEADLSERDLRQQLLNDEVTRAEAQIQLITDVLLRDAGL